MDMALISLRDVGVVTPRTLFQDINLNIGTGDRVGLIAGNGGGKSTLLRCIAGQADPDRGSVTLSRGLRVGHVEQVSPSVVLGYADQGMAHLPDGLTPHRFVSAWPGIGDGRATGLLAGAGFSVEHRTGPSAVFRRVRRHG